MGRNTIRIEKVESKHPRNYAYVQRKRGLLKKAIELSILCGQDLFLVMYDRECKKLVTLSSSDDFNAKAVDQLIDPALHPKMNQVEIYSNKDLPLFDN